MQNYDERGPLSISGYLFLVLLLAAIGYLSWPLVADPSNTTNVVFLVPALVVSVILLSGFYIVQPNTAKVLTFLGRYVGTDNNEGLRWTIPFLIARQTVSKRLRNFESTKSKVNDATGNPIEIAGIVVWRITSPAASVFGVENVSEFVTTQGEAAIRALASAYPNGSSRHTESGALTLLGHPNEIADHLQRDLQDRVADVGVTIGEARISHLAYAPEIAAAMLQRQQADALVDAREVIVDGAIGMVDMALRQLDEKHIVDLDPAAKAALVSNLLVVLSGDHSAHPVIQAGAPTDKF